MHLLLYFLAGVLAANGIPHFIKGITGERHATPFGKRSSAAVNVVWGAINLGAAWFLWRFAGHNTGHAYRYLVAFGVGLLLMAIFLAQTGSKSSKK